MTSVKVSHIEVVQSIQTATNEDYIPTPCTNSVTTGGVPLVTGKTTFARVYFENFNPQDRIGAEGVITVEYTDSGGVPGTATRSSNRVVNRYVGASPSLIDQRLNWTYSLNFELDGVLIEAQGEKKIRLESLTDTITNLPIEIIDPSTPPDFDVVVEFQAEQKLTCRALIFRYRDVKNDVYLEPTREEVNTIRSYVERSFPVSEVEWSVIRIEAQRDFYALDPATQYEREHDETATKMLSKMLHQIMAHRNQELKDGFSRKTYYIGVFSDPRGRFGSVAVDAPPLPLPHVVAACATDTTGEDGAHEIAHLLGRSHPGVPLREVHGRYIGQYRIDGFALSEMGPEGHLSHPDRTAPEDIYIGLDTDTSNHAPSPLAPTRTFDLMSYRNPRWPSAYTYRELYQRLACTPLEDQFHCEPDRNWTVICSFDINQKDGQILSVLPTNYLTPQKPAAFASLEQLIVKRAVDELESQLDWLIDNGDPKFKKIWQLFQDSIPTFTLKPVPPVHEQDEDVALAYTVSNYNGFINGFINRLIDEFERPFDQVISLLTSNNIAIELYEPDIRIFPNYDNGETSCPEEDIDYMWNADEAINVYYRRVGSKDRFPFGLLQATVPGKDGTKKPPTSITLMIDKIVVDKYAQSFVKKAKAKKIAKAIFDLTDCIHANNCAGVTLLPVGNGDTCEDRPSSNSLVYDIRKDSYYLNFHWPMAVLRQLPSNQRAATITTTIQCWRRSLCEDSDVVDNMWETVFVTNELRGQVWISPDLFEIHYPDPGCPVERPSAQKPQRPIRSREQDRLQFRFVITVGFFEFSSDVYFSPPVLVIPRREDRFEPVDSDDQCPDDFQYDDDTAALFD